MRWVIIACALVLGACNVANTASDAGEDGGMPDDGSAADGAIVDGSVDGGLVDDAGYTDSGACQAKNPLVSPPGPAVTSRDAVGGGSCAGVTLGTVVDTIHAAHPELADITEIYGSLQYQQDGSFIYAYAMPDGGFAIVFKRGGGDCPAGCTEVEYWYFSTDATCAPMQVGHYHPTYGSRDGGGGCTEVEGEPMWATPRPPDPMSVCGANPQLEDVSGTYQLCASGEFFRCSVKGGDQPIVPVPSALTMVVAQDAADLSKGTVVVTGTGHTLVDGVALDATFTLRQFTASKTYSNLPANCPEEWTVFVSYDFDGYEFPGRIGWNEFRGVDCGDKPAVNMCKGQGNATIVVR